MRLLLSEPLPLRTSAMLGNFAEVFVLPHRLGDLTGGRFKLYRLDDTTFFVADHPMAVTQVFVDRQETKSWERRLQFGDGHTWTVVKFAAPVPLDAAVSARGIGAVNQRTGALVENPADCAEYVMALAERDDPWWDQLRAESAAEGLRLAGSIDSVQSIRTWIDAILASAGAIWCPGMARLYPTSTVSGYVAPLDRQKVSTVKATANLDNTCDILRAYFDPDVAGGGSQRYVELEASPMLYGGIVREQTFTWLRTSVNAESVGRRVLQWCAGERWDLQFPCGDRQVGAGQWAKLISIPGWQLAGDDPTAMVTDATPNEETGNVDCNAIALLSIPDVTVTAHSVALPTTRDAGVELAVANGVGTFTFTGSDGRAVLDGRASLDNGPAKRTDANGRVTFTGSPGPHKLAWQAPGKRAQTLTVLF